MHVVTSTTETAQQNHIQYACVPFAYIFIRYNFDIFSNICVWVCNLGTNVHHTIAIARDTDHSKMIVRYRRTASPQLKMQKKKLNIYKTMYTDSECAHSHIFHMIISCRTGLGIYTTYICFTKLNHLSMDLWLTVHSSAWRSNAIFSLLNYIRMCSICDGGDDDNVLDWNYFFSLFFCFCSFI